MITPTLHRVPGEMLAELATGGGGEPAVALLRRVQRSKHRAVLLSLVRETIAADHPHARLATHAYQALADLETRAPASVNRVLAYPAVGSWLWQSLKSVGAQAAAPGLDPGLLGTLPIVAAIDAGLSHEQRLPLFADSLTLPSLGRLRLPRPPGEVTVATRPGPGGALLTIDGLTSTVTQETDSPHWDALRRVPLPGGPVLTIDDLDPCRWPDVTTRCPRLDMADHPHWSSRLTEAWSLLRTGHPATAAEVAAAISVVTPIEAPGKGLNSATAREVFGTIAMSEPPDAVTTASTLAHEIQHAKLTALQEVVQLTEPGHTTRYYAPWRKDPRPVYGLLQGVYAYLGVTAFWRRQRRLPDHDQGRAHSEFARWRQAVHDGTASLLAGDGLTPEGRDFVGVIRDTVAAWLPEPVPDRALTQARAAATRHRSEWIRRNRPR
ncbi:HEXXH motif domain-containing protein [Acrocarpospora catenulata]|uniref:HEXXH motif domain-containing protein n=1 Tax=Acrocarpospora catenulata TaxID=2836182 RepID=UPI001BDA2FDB|nr:HEXXH motif domain-containing protein [Acrocarpospora catenulata]